MKNIILFGASGFLGTQLRNKLTGNIIPISLRQQTWQNKLAENSDIYINCIGKAHDHRRTASQKDFYDANLEIVNSLFHEFINSSAKLFIHVSSIAAVEEFEREEPLIETSVQHPVSWYGRSKKAGEDFLLEQRLPSEKKIIIIRPCMIHGEGDKGNLELLYKVISKGVPYPFGSFDNKRSFVSIDNLCYLFQQIIDNSEIIPSGIYNIADDNAVSTSQLVNIIASLENIESRTLNVPKSVVNLLGKVGDILKLPISSKKIKKLTSTLTVSNQKIKTTLGIKELPVSAEEGIIKTIKSFQNKWNTF